VHVARLTVTRPGHVISISIPKSADNPAGSVQCYQVRVEMDASQPVSVSATEVHIRFVLHHRQVYSVSWDLCCLRTLNYSHQLLLLLHVLIASRIYANG
jgi:hypothetical protein